MSRIAWMRPYVLGLLGVAIITFPFLWLGLNPDFDNNTVTLNWTPGNGARFFEDLLPVFVVSFLIWLGVRANRYWGLGQSLGRTSAWRWTSRAWDVSWAWIAMPLVLSAPYFLSPSTLGLMTFVGIYMLLALGLNITVGMTGLLVLGYAGFYAFGAYVFAIAQQHLPWLTWWMALPVVFLLGGIVGYVLGLPCLRLRGDYLAIVTLGFAEAFRETIRNLPFAGADQGISLATSTTFRPFWGLTGSQAAYVFTALTLFLAVFLVQRLYHSPVGRAWIAIRENEVAAASVGVPVVQMKLLAFSLSAAVAAVAGVLSASKDGFISPSICEFQVSIMVLAMVILGGLGNTYGALLGAALLYLVPEYLKRFSMVQDTTWLPSFLTDSLKNLSDYRLLLFGAVMVLMMLYRPQGLLGTSRRKLEMQNA